MTSSSLSPKNAFSLKKASVSFLVGPEVMTNHVILALSSPPTSCLATSSSRLILSAWYWNSVLPDGSPMSKHPLGADEPNRVPCPPAMRRTATWDFAMAVRPAVRQAAVFVGSARTEVEQCAGRGSMSSDPSSTGRGDAAPLIFVGGRVRRPLDSSMGALTAGAVANECPLAVGVAG